MFFKAKIFINQKVNKTIDDNKHVILKLEQRRFFKNAKKTKDSSKASWKIPITVKTKSSYPGIHTTVLMDKQECEIDLGALTESDYILLNSDYIGFYRCQYSRDMFNDILNALKSSETLIGSSLDRISILNDTFALVSILSNVYTTFYLLNSSSLVQ